MLCTLIGSPRVQADACFKKCKFRKYKFWKYKFRGFVEGFKNVPFISICDQHILRKKIKRFLRMFLLEKSATMLLRTSGPGPL